MTFNITTLRKADSDIRNIARYIHEHSPSGASAWLKALERASTRLVDEAERCSEAPENENFDIEIKQMLFKTKRGNVYRLVFTIIEDDVRILRVRGQGQAPVEPEDI